MRTITIPSGTYEVDFAWAPTVDGGCMIQQADERRLPEIAAEFDGLEEIHFTDGAAEREYDWHGYTKLTRIMVLPDGKIQIFLTME